ncbi:MAG: hypothetical protein VX712_09330 [Bacteroidota bacterium]|uniref:hypothetical protein n=1 Tax=Christiangramia sp. TaxID=1931228 RepID=UPI000C38C3B9|nr:hypothetical protein [Christiangramia sp.]MEE2772408.1 hypothetical protein [Bacteroidota bacterium]
MPANPKYLTQSNWQRFAKITAGILGGYALSVTMHMVLALVFDPVKVLITSTYSIFILWATLMILAFLARNGWKILGIYLLISLVFCAMVYFGNAHNPINS